jgi:MFS family permease
MKGVYHGWTVVGATFLITVFGWGLGFHGTGVYLVTLQQRHGWSTADISSAITMYYLLAAAFVLSLGSVFQWLGPRLVIVTGVVAMVVGLVSLTFVTQPWQVYVAFAVMSVGWASMSGASINIILAPWFEKRRGLALSLALNGASIGGAVMVPLLLALINHFDFTPALALAAGLMLVVLLPTATVALRPKHPDEHDSADPPVSRAPPTAEPAAPGQFRQISTILLSPYFRATCVPYALGLTAQVGLFTHQIAYLSPILGTTDAGWAVSLTSVSAVTGRIVTGLFIDRVSKRITAGVNFIVQIVGVCLLASSVSPPVLYAGCILFGVATGNNITLPGLIAQQEFQKHIFPFAISLIISVNQFTFAFGPALIGYLKQFWGSYTGPLLLCLLMQGVAAVVVVLPTLPSWRRSGDEK